MTIDEAIKHAEEVAEEHERHLSDFFEETGDEEDSERFDRKRKRRRR